MADRLLDVKRTTTARWTGSLEIVPLPRDRCLRCGAQVEQTTFGQPALFVHGGYGATERTTLAICSAPGCWWWRTTDITEVNPRR